MCGYYTSFFGSLKITPLPDGKTIKLIHRLAKYPRIGYDTRCLAQLAGLSENEVEERWGDEGEFFFPKRLFFGKKWWKVAKLNRPPRFQPDLLNYWEINSSGCLEVVKGECDFYEYDRWLRYLIDRVFHPRGYLLSGFVEWQGEETNDRGTIRILENQVIKVERFNKPNIYL